MCFAGWAAADVAGLDGVVAVRRRVKASLRDRLLLRRPGWQVLAAGMLGRVRLRELRQQRAMSRTRHALPALSDATPVMLAFPEVATPQVSVIIPVFNQWAMTRTCLESLVRHAPLPLMEVVVVDDASSDATVDEAVGIPGLRVVRNHENLGFTRTANRGASVARAPFLLFLNNDTRVQPGWLEGLLDAMSDPTVGAAGSKLCFPSGLLQEAGGLIWNDGSGWNIGRGRMPHLPEYNHRRDVDYCSGASLMVRTTLFEAAGGFDERFAPAYYEDTDLCFTLRSLGHRVVYEPSSVVIHDEGGTHGTERRPAAAGAHGKDNQYRNRERFTAKWAAELARHLPPPVEAVALAELRGSLREAAPRVLYCDVTMPTPDRDAGSLRAASMLRLLASMSSRVTLVPMDGVENQPYADKLRADGVEVVPGNPFGFARFARRRAGLYDMVVLSRPEAAVACLKDVRRQFPDATVVFDTTDLRFLRQQRQLAVTGAADGGDPQRMRALELGLVDKCDVTATVTEAEADMLRALRPSADVVVLPTVHAPRTDPPASLASRRGMLFIGSFRHAPNADAMRFFLDDVLPLVRGRIPGLELVVIGADPPDDLLHRDVAGVRFAGYVEDVTPFFDAARVFVSPLRFGAGMKGKNGQAMALGLPMVTTPIGAEGMGLVDGTHALIAADAAAFAGCITRLHKDDALWSHVAASARELADEQWGPEAMRARLQSLLERAASRRGAGTLAQLVS